MRLDFPPDDTSTEWCHGEGANGFGHPYQATLFPQSIGMGATWDASLARDAGAATREQLVATGGTWDFAPVQDLARDNRWGRYYETWAEAPVRRVVHDSHDVVTL